MNNYCQFLSGKDTIIANKDSIFAVLFAHAKQLNAWQNPRVAKVVRLLMYHLSQRVLVRRLNILITPRLKVRLIPLLLVSPKKLPMMAFVLMRCAPGL